MSFMTRFGFILFLLLLPINTCLNEESEPIVSTQSSHSTHSSHSLPLTPIDFSILSNCKQKSNYNSYQKELLVISTLDGKLSVLDVEEGDLIWSKQFDSALLSSTISNFEITKKGQILRIVPALDGNLYLYNGKTIDGIPLNAETLLKSSYKLGDDLVITGGQESKVSAIDISTGRVLYECGLNGCPSAQLNENETFDDLFLVKRITQTVRAIDPNTGREKWFFSVTEPQLSKTPSSRCEDPIDSSYSFDQNEDKTIIDRPSDGLTQFKVIVPNGFISATRHSKSDEEIEWNYKFDSPIVHVWHYRNSQIDSLNLFDKQKLFGFTNNDLNLNDFQPSIYIGLYDHQWYVQSSNEVKAYISESKIQNDLLTSETENKLNSNVLQIEWKPQALILSDKSDIHSEDELQLVSSPQFSLSISSLNDENIGYYIFDVIEDNETKCLINSSEKQNIDLDSDKCEDENTLVPQIVIASLWYYWREVTAISIISAFLLNFCLSLLKRKLKIKCKLNANESNENICSNSQSSIPSLSSNSPSIQTSDNFKFVSRYEEDFQPIQVLGKGGFGLVFEAKHRIDESHYAVKRICLPNRKDQRDKVMREVKALSKLDHSGIVRYYNAWLECPPPGWQPNRDKLWINEDISVTHFNDLSKQISNKSVVSFDKQSSHNTSQESSSEEEFECNESKLVFTGVQTSQSLDIVFDENVFSIKVLENKKSYSLFETNISKHKTINSLANIMESKEDFNEIENIESLVKSCRPNDLNLPLQKYYLFIQMQLCRKDTLKDWLFNNAHNRDINIVLDIFDQIVSAVHYVHSVGLMHRDLKPSNIFFSIDGNIKIGDFGLVTATATDDETHTPASNDSVEDNSNILTQSSSSHTNRVGTQLYMSPEQIRNAPYSHKVDIFSMGIILFELLVPFKTQMERNILLINARKQIFPKDFCQKFISECDLLKKLLSHNPENRPSAAEIKEHEMFRNLQSKCSIGRQRSRTVSLSNECNV